MELNRLIRKLAKFYPLSSSDPWDYPGLQVDVKDYRREIKKIFLALDMTEEILPQVKSYMPDIIITHHPLIFGKKKDVFEWDVMKESLVETIERMRIPLYSYHTCFDKGRHGMNDTLVEIMGFYPETVVDDPYIRIADCKRTVEEMVDLLKEKFNLPYLQYMDNNKGRKAKRFALVGGGGSSCYRTTMQLGIELLISGDCSHSRRLDMRRYGLSYIELPHEVEEVGFLVGMKNMLLTIDPTLDIYCCAYEKYFDMR